MHYTRCVMAFIHIIACLAFGIGALMPGPVRALDRSQLAVIVNTLDPLSVQIGRYYARARRISFQNVIEVSFPPDRTTLSREEFEALKIQVDKQTRPDVQAYALTWAAPYRVDCMSITAAFAFGFDPAYCAEDCRFTRRSPYYNSPSPLPAAQLNMRPTMAIAATTFAEARALIDRGVKSDGTRPAAKAYLLSTSDKARNVRASVYSQAEKAANGRAQVFRLERDALLNETNVMFYFTGKEQVEGLDTLTFAPGAIADHLTSAGGRLTDSWQMSALRWLEAGATASYGAVSEPCNIPHKFPHPAIVIGRYLQGETLIEAYWKSVLMPGQGIFVGEPLAAPFRRPATAR